jgi:Tfp pilus assembly protein PilN
MRAVNLIPGDARKGGAGRSVSLDQVPAYVVLGALAVLVAFAALYVLTNNKIGDRQAQVTSLKAQVAQTQAQAGSLANYAVFEQTATTRVLTVRELAATRFDWHAALSNLSRVVPKNTSLTTITGTVSSGSTGASGGSGLRAAITAPALELSGCTASQDDVARLMSRLRLINGVTRVSLSSSQEATPSSVASASTPGSAQGCGAGTPTFSIVAFFKPLAGAGASGATSLPTLTNTPTKASK